MRYINKTIVHKKKFVKNFKINQIDKFNNEILGFKYFNKLRIFTIPKILKSTITKKKLSIEFEKINNPNKNFNFFKLKKFYKFKNIKFKKIKTDNYLKYLLNKLKKFKNSKNKMMIKIIKEIINKNSNKFIEISPAHGDFVHYNVFYKNSKFYVFDFEHFNKKQSIHYDFLNWFYEPLFNYILRLKLNNFSSYIINIYFNFIKLFFFDFFSVSKNKNKKIYLDLFLIEKVIFYSKEINLHENIKSKKIKIIYKYFLKRYS